MIVIYFYRSHNVIQVSVNEYAVYKSGVRVGYITGTESMAISLCHLLANRCQ